MSEKLMLQKIIHFEGFYFSLALENNGRNKKNQKINVRTLKKDVIHSYDIRMNYII